MARAVRIAVLGADGRMGRALTRAVFAAGPRAVLAAATERPGHAGVGKDAGTVAGGEPMGVLITDAMPTRSEADVWIDFTAASATESVATAAASQGVGLVVGTTGLGTHARAALDVAALRAAQIIARVGQRIAVLSGDDATAFPLFALGGRGVISVVSNVAPALMSAMWDAAAAGDWNQARQLHYRLLPLGEGLFVEANPIPVKAALAMMGRMTEEIRPPLYPLAEQYRAKLRAQLDELGLLAE